MSVFAPRLIAVGLMATGLLAVVGAAQAATYPPLGGPSVSVDTTSPVVGGIVAVTASGFAPTSDVDFTVSTGTSAMSAGSGGAGRTGTAVSTGTTCSRGAPCTVVANATGLASAQIKLTQAGPVTITVSGVDTANRPVTKTVSLVVRAAPIDDSTRGSGLVDTGATRTAQLFGLGVALILLGALTYSARHRRRSVGATN